MNDALNRLKGLFSELGLNANEGISAAEIEACASGIEMVAQYYKDCIDRIFIPLDKPNSLWEYIQLIGRYVLPTGSENRELISTRLSTGTYYKNDLENAIRCVNPNLTYSINNKVITFDNFTGNDLCRLGDFIKGYVPYTLVATINGSKSSFDEWDSFGKPWYVLDSYGFPFSVIEQMEVNKYE